MSQITVDRRSDGIVVVTLDQPARRNAITLAMWREVGSLFPELGRDPAVRAVILTGAGEHFSAGADIADFTANRATLEAAHAYEGATDGAEDAMLDFPKPVIAAIEGFCIGGACGLALACDRRIASAGASFAITPARLGIVYGQRETELLAATVGFSEAKKILYGGDRFDAAHALKIGLIDEIAPGTAMEAALAYAANLAERAPLSIAGAKTVLNGLMRGAPDAKAIRAAMDRALLSADYREGRDAFAAKRKPVFRGE